ncbi:Putative Na+/H+ antiporter [hydrothermal vent metagenome]|uniref:Na+/H+ antiporter n=1 Tax=hydrothermal vent metagenome TaxID=652676 RepID=A0A3B1C3B2_9ZZZZ
MAASIALIALLGLLSDYIFRKLRLPGLLGMLMVGVASGPYVFDIIEPALLEISSELRMTALIVILLRAGLELRRDTLNRVGKTAVTMSVVPAIFEGVAITLIAPILLPLTYIEAAILGSVLAAVSPAVVVPLMLKFIDERRGTDKGIPTMILGASSVDDVFVIVIFTILLGMGMGNESSGLMKLLEIPESVLLGIAFGALIGYVLFRLFDRYKPRATKMTIVVIAVSVILTWVEEAVHAWVAVSALLGVMTVGFVILEKAEARAHKISQKLSKVWIFAEILLFVLVGAQVDISVAWNAGALGALLVMLGLVARSAGTWLSVAGSDFTVKERLFCVIAYVPKATVQAAVGAVPLEMGIPGGEIILAVAVLSILLTAPVGAVAIMYTGPKWLKMEVKRDVVAQTE